MRKIVLLSLVIVTLVLLGACTKTETPVKPEVAVKDQTITDNAVTLDKVASLGPGWLVIHVDKDSKPGEIIGYAAVKQGTTTGVKVTVDATKATSKLWAMLHIDAGTIGTYEFPGADVPVKIGDVIVMTPFAVKTK